MPTPFLSFETERLLLKPTDEADANFIFRLFNTPKWLQFIGDRQLRSEADACQYIQQRMLPQFIRLGYGNYTIIEQNTQTKIGLCGLYDREGLSEIDLGFAFFPEFEGKGFGFEAASKLIEVAKDSFKMTDLCAITDENNLASQKLLAKLGFTFKEKICLGDADEVFYFTRSLV